MARGDDEGASVPIGVAQVDITPDYPIRMSGYGNRKTECDGGRLRVGAYCNDVPCYIASKRLIGEGGYEVDRSMQYYDRPTRLDPAAEDRIIGAVPALLPDSFNPPRPR
jgi:hypothetical protein